MIPRRAGIPASELPKSVRKWAQAGHLHPSTMLRPKDALEVAARLRHRPELCRRLHELERRLLCRADVLAAFGENLPAEIPEGSATS